MRDFATCVMVLALVAGCGPGEVSCRCVGRVAEGTLSVACGATQCLGGTLYACTAANTATVVGTSCEASDAGGPGRDSGAPPATAVTLTVDGVEWSAGYLDLFVDLTITNGTGNPPIPVSVTRYTVEFSDGTIVDHNSSFSGGGLCDNQLAPGATRMCRTYFASNGGFLASARGRPVRLYYEDRAGGHAATAEIAACSSMAPRGACDRNSDCTAGVCVPGF